MGQIEYSGEHYPTTGDGLNLRGQLPWHLGPQKDQCVIHPVTSVFVCTEHGRQEYQQGGAIHCNCEHGHEEENPLARPYELNELPEATPGWTVQKHEVQPLDKTALS